MKSLKDDRFEMNLSKRLGTGNFADVYSAIDKQTNQEVAIKVIAMNKIRQYGVKLEKAIEKEIHVLKTLTQYDNPYLLRFIDCFDTSNNKYLVLEFCNGGTMGDLLKKRRALPEDEALEYCYQMVLGLSALEEASISHRDLKPDNVFLHNNICKIGDFGFASHESKFTSSLGTCVYMAPEFYVGKGTMNSKVDVWAFGITLHQMIFQDFPFDGNSQPEVISGVVNKVYNPPSNPKISPLTADVLRKCLDKDPDRRISFKELRNHPAFKKWMPTTQNRLGNDVKMSLFGNDMRNVYQAVMQQGKTLGYIKEEVPETTANQNREKKNKQILKALVDWKNGYMFFSEISNNLEQIKDASLASFFMLKRALQKAAHLLYYIKDEKQPPATILPDVAPSDWEDFLKEQAFVNFLPYVINDVITLRSIFEKKLEILRNLYVGYDARYQTLINDDLEIDHRELLIVLSKETVRKLIGGAYPQGVDLAAKILVSHNIEKNDAKSPYLDNIREKVDALLKYTEEQKRKVIENFIK